MRKDAYYEAHMKTVEDALALIRDDDAILTNNNAGEARLFLENLHKVFTRVNHLTVWGNFASKHFKFMDEPGLSYRATFMDGGSRGLYQSGKLEYSCGNLSNYTEIVTQTKKPRIYVTCVSPMDENGMFYSSLDLSWGECIDHADIVICEVNRNMPRVFGNTGIPIEKVTCFYESTLPILTIDSIPITETERQIAENVCTLVKDGDCIQLGIGGMPNAVGEALTNKHDLGIHTEMITGCMRKLIESGAVNNSKKQIHNGITIGAFAFGDRTLYDFLDNNEKIRLMTPTYVNNPFVISQNNNVVSINTCLEVDFTGQICSESIGPKQYTGTGGAFDYAYGAFRSEGGRGIIAFSSTTKNGTVSKIKPLLTPGAVVSISRNIAGYVVTEYGVAKLRNESIRQRTLNLISVAHPDFRKDLLAQAHDLLY